MFVWEKNIEFYKGKSNCKAIVIADWGLGQSPGGVPGGKTPKLFCFLMPLRWGQNKKIVSVSPLGWKFFFGDAGGNIFVNTLLNFS